MAAEAECVAQSYVDSALLSLVEGEIERIVDILVFVAFLVVDRRGNDVFFDSENREHCLESAGGAEKMAGH